MKTGPGAPLRRRLVRSTRGSWTAGKAALHLVSAWAADNRLVLAQCMS